MRWVLNGILLKENDLCVVNGVMLTDSIALNCSRQATSYNLRTWRDVFASRYDLLAKILQGSQAGVILGDPGVRPT